MTAREGATEVGDNETEKSTPKAKSFVDVPLELNGTSKQSGDDQEVAQLELRQENDQEKEDREMTDDKVKKVSSNGLANSNGSTLYLPPSPPRHQILIAKRLSRDEKELKQDTTNNSTGKGEVINLVRPGCVRHMIAVLALSSIVMANMNRQVFNQALVSMTRTQEENATSIEQTAENTTEPTIDTTTVWQADTSSNVLDQRLVVTTTESGPTEELETGETVLVPGLPLSTSLSDEAGATGATGELVSTNQSTIAPDSSQIQTTTETSASSTSAESTTTDAANNEEPTTPVETSTPATQSPPAATTTTSQLEIDDRFDWDQAKISGLQAAFSWGYLPLMVPGGRMSELYGAKWVVFVSGFGSALCSALTPFLADTHYNLLWFSQVFMGVCQTGVSPALYALLTRWLPPNESNVYLPMIKVGVQVGFTLGALVGGLFAWRVAFYFVGAIGLIWSTMWILLVTSDPNDHKLISKKERDLIVREIALLNKGRKQSAGTARKAAAPWLRIMTNPVVLAFMFAKFTVKLSTDAQTKQLPMYMKKVFKVSKELNGVLTASNSAIQGIFTGLVAWMAKEFVVRKMFGLSKTGVRRLFQGTCNYGMGLAYILMTFNMASLNVVICAVILLSIASMFGAGGEAVLPVDLSTQYSASIMAIANTSANLSGVILPSLVAYVLGDQDSSSDRWNVVWWIVGGLMVAGATVFACLVRAEIQDFGRNSGEEKSDSVNGLNGINSNSTMIEMKIRSQAIVTNN